MLSRMHSSLRALVVTKENVIRHLQDNIGTDMKTRNKIIRLIFNPNYLTTVTDVGQYNNHAATIVQTLTSKTAPSFLNYFSNRICPLLRSNFVAGLPRWTSNNVESMNHMFKQAVNWRPHMLPDLIVKLQSLVAAQLYDVQRALYGRGDFKLRPSHTSFPFGEDNWSKMSEKKCALHARKSFVIIQCPNQVTSTNGKLTVIHKASAGLKKNQVKRKRCAKSTTLLHSRIRNVGLIISRLILPYDYDRLSQTL